MPLVLAAGRLTATLLVACIAACSRTSCWVTGCGRRRWRRWRLNAKGSEDTIEAIFGPPETRNHRQFTYEKKEPYGKKDLQTCTRYPFTNLLLAKNDTNIWSQRDFKGYGRSFGCFTLQQPVHNTLRTSIPCFMPSHKEICR